MSVKTPSAWREFSFALHRIQQAIHPRLPLSAVLNQWNSVAMNLSESYRVRRPMLEFLS